MLRRLGGRSRPIPVTTALMFPPENLGAVISAGYAAGGGPDTIERY